MDPQKLLATLIHLSDEQQQRGAALLSQLEGQAQTLTRASQRAERAADALERGGPKTALHLQAAVREGVETALHATLTTASQRAERAFEDAGRPLLQTLAEVSTSAEAIEQRLQRAVGRFHWRWALLAGGAALAAVAALLVGAWLIASVLLSGQRAELARLHLEIARSETRLQALNRRGGKIEFGECGGRLCVYAAPDQGKGSTGWRGPWYSTKDGSPLVIPKGY